VPHFSVFRDGRRSTANSRLSVRYHHPPFLKKVSFPVDLRPLLPCHTHAAIHGQTNTLTPNASSEPVKISIGRRLFSLYPLSFHLSVCVSLSSPPFRRFLLPRPFFWPFHSALAVWGIFGRSERTCGGCPLRARHLPLPCLIRYGFSFWSRCSPFSPFSGNFSPTST